VERVVAGAIHASVAGLIALPAMMLLMARVSGISVHPNWPLLLPLVVLSGLLSASFGLTLGSQVQPRFAGLLFAIVLGPMMLFGCAYYPWRALDAVPLMKWLVTLNPLTYVSEALRATLTPSMPHMPIAITFGVLALLTTLFTMLGLRSFRKRAIG